MKKLLDLVLILLVLGTPVFLFVVLPEQEKQERRTPRNTGDLELPPLPEGSESPSDPSSGSNLSPPSPGETPEVVRVPPSRPTGLRIRGFYYRGGSSPLSGEVPIDFAGGGEPVVASEGRFSFDLPAGVLALRHPDRVVDDSFPMGTIPIPAGSGDGILSVHRYYPGEEGELITPLSALLLQAEALGPPRLLVRGQSLLPDGAEIAVRLLAAGFLLEATLLRVNDGEFSGELPLSERDFHAGAYQLQFAWGPELATSRVRVAMAESRWADLPGEIQRDLGVFFGTPGEARVQARAIEQFYRGALDELEGTRDFMLVVGAEARRKRNKLLDDPERVSRMRRNPLARLHDGLFQRRKLRVEPWRELIDEKVPELVSPYLRIDAIPYVSREPRAAHHLVELARLITKHAKLESRVAYDALGLKPHPGNYVADFDFPPKEEKRQTLQKIRKIADAIRDYLDLD